MLPDVHGEDSSLAFGNRVHGVGGFGDGELTLPVNQEPCPTGAELGSTSVLELVLKLIEGAKVTVNGLRELTRGNTTTVGLHALPEEGMVPDLGSLIKDGGGISIVPRGNDNLVKTLSLKGSASNKLVEHVIISTMMLSPVIVKGLFAHMRLKGIKGIRRGLKIKGSLGRHIPLSKSKRRAGNKGTARDALGSNVRNLLDGEHFKTMYFSFRERNDI
mmetsp:Transcript_24139/g.43190  ORF Transcript_24139/g.43190 Transcript_24139/m.43190 type:complete len:217 (-) Transcript_24139:58-708(-)